MTSPPPPSSSSSFFPWFRRLLPRPSSVSSAPPVPGPSTLPTPTRAPNLGLQRRVLRFHSLGFCSLQHLLRQPTARSSAASRTIPPSNTSPTEKQRINRQALPRRRVEDDLALEDFYCLIFRHEGKVSPASREPATTSFVRRPISQGARPLSESSYVPHFFEFLLFEVELGPCALDEYGGHGN